MAVGDESMINSLVEIESVRLYANRIDAEPRSLNKLVITKKSGRYWKDIHQIKLDLKTGEVLNIEKLPKEIKPTDAEQAAMQAAISSAEFPEYVQANKIQIKGLIETINKSKNKVVNADDKDLFIFFNEASDKVLMVQQRIIDEKTGQKKYLPWTYWSDGKWRIAEPEGKLPLYGLETLKDNAVVVLHEGCKGAKHWQELIAENKTHPWREYLKHAAHIGWVGGALNPHRTDWSPLNQSGLDLVIIAADNDQAGKRAIPKISKLLNVRCHAIEFLEGEDYFPIGFDLADDIPKKMFDRQGDYVGPGLQAMTIPATWLTRKYQPQGRKSPPMTVLQDHVKGEWLYITDHNEIVHRDFRHKPYDRQTANNALSDFSDAKDIFGLLVKNKAEHIENYTYDPSSKGRIILNGGHKKLNLYEPTRIKPKDGDASPFMEYLNNLFPIEEDREHVKLWIATLIAKPGVRMTYSILLVSEKQGVGKSTLGEAILAPLVGNHNSCCPSEEQILSRFNSWAGAMRLAIVAEIYQGKSWKMYNRLKSVISDDTISIERKGKDAITTRNWCHIIASSNSPAPLKVSEEDRRWLVPKVTEEAWPHKKWCALREWLNKDGLAIILHWAQSYGKYEMSGMHAPGTERKKDLIQVCTEEYRTLLTEILIENENPKPLKTLFNYLKVEDNDSYFTQGNVRQILKGRGYINNGRREVVCEVQQKVWYLPSKIDAKVWGATNVKIVI